MVIRLVAVFLFAVGVSGAWQDNFSGTWKLLVEKSQWSSPVKPISVTLVVDHKDPMIVYVGSVLYTGEDTREFSFAGNMDGKAYPMTRSFGKGQVTLFRIDPTTFESVFRSDDKAWTETARTSLSRDGRVMTRRLRLQGPEGTRTWTEVYERR